MNALRTTHSSTRGRGANRWCAALALSAALWASVAGAAAAPVPLPYREPIQIEGDIASNLVAGVDRFLLRQTELSISRRAQFWQRDFSSTAAYERSIQTNRARLAHILGVRDARPTPPEMERSGPVASPTAGEASAGIEVQPVRWRAFGEVHGEGLLLTPRGRGPLADVVAVPDADQTPEQIAGLAMAASNAVPYARLLAEHGCRVLVPVLIDRQLERRHAPGAGGGATLTRREYLQRSAYVLGRHLIGYETQKILAGVDWFVAERTRDPAARAPRRIGVVGWGEGGLLALYAGALDPRLDVVVVSGYFESRQDLWQEPVDRNVFGLLERFGDAELASLIAPRPLLIEAARGPEVTLSPGQGGAPGRLRTPPLASVQAEVARARALVRELSPTPTVELLVSEEGAGPSFQTATMQRTLQALGVSDAAPVVSPGPVRAWTGADIQARQQRQQRELDAQNQTLLTESPYVRRPFLDRLDTRSPVHYADGIESRRAFFYDEVIGRCSEPPLPLHPRGRLAYDQPKWTGHEIVLDVFPDVIAYGVLLLPKDLREGERRPVVVCQHGLEGRPQDTIEGDHWAYHNFAARLAERGFIVFAPQNLYLFGDRFRTLQRKANPLQLTLYSVITPQHEQILAWLKTLPYVDPGRIGFYGLSYGGKTAMRVPALLPDYCLSICSADFNDWVWKNASTRSPYSYVWTGEYEIFEFDLGSTFNYAEMAALIAPRPFMVERGHFDGVAPDETVAAEFAKVRHLYAARLGVPERCAIDWFVGPHTIHGEGTFAFLHRYLAWPAPKGTE